MTVLYVNTAPNNPPKSSSRWGQAKATVSIGSYLPRQNHQTAIYRLVFHYHEQLVSLWESCFQQRYGLLRPVVESAFRAYLDCGVYERGCVRIRCPDCAHELYLAFSCKRRGICASCAAKRGVIFGEKLQMEVLAPVPHQHVVFTIPKRIRPYFLHDRTLLGILFSAAWKALKNQLGSTAAKTVPGAVMALHTAGETLAFHPHIHCIVSSGAFSFDNPDSFRQKTIDPDALKKTFEREVARMMSKKFEELLPIFDQILQQENTGFNIWAGDIVSSDDHDTRRFLGRYLMRHPFAVDRIVIKKNKVEVVSTKESVITWKGTPLEFL